MTLPEPSSPLRSPYAETAYTAAFESAVREGIWRPEHTFGLEMFARSVGSYVTMAIKAGHDGDQEQRAYRQLAREMAFEWYLVDTATLPPLRADGIDPDLAWIAGLTATVQ